ncbi:MAG: hypothetical protein RML38_07965 [Bacteroidia bacterium]|nr:hypothetical protein [Bacteroidia bacterium]
MAVCQNPLPMYVLFDGASVAGIIYITLRHESIKDALYHASLT